MNNRIEKIKQRLTEALAPDELEIIDDSHKHIGHAGAADGLGHFTVIIEAESLENLSRIQQHQAIYTALGKMMTTDIHALKIKIIR